ncbi:MAG: 1-deoxy-D-xylulose-5-phosphate reductoisomerase [Alphaproteobacteria bacterium]|nr:1-deoxy-D-xylulose-5-phosphate reductoisomerase [Alphaproteobacteria bacterium]
MKKKVTIFGSTGSIGLSTLDIINQHNDKYEIVGLSINNNYKKLLEQVSKFKPKIVSIKDSMSFEKFKNKNTLKNLKILNGNDSFDDILDYETDIVVAAITGSAGLLPVVGAVKRGITIALANKESLVCSGSLVTSLAKKNGSMILPVDSEHNAIYQVLDLKNKNNVSKLILTASGGPFLNKKLDDLENITPEEAIKHPNWSMGKKISVDSATMMNKGLELIEAHYLFDMPHEKIDIVVHPESIIHSCVEYSDGSILSQMGNPDMRTPISYTLAYPDRIPTHVEKLKLSEIKKLTFFEPDFNKFPCLELAYTSLKIKKSAPTVLNAANEIAVDAFLNRKIAFLSIHKIVEKTLNKASISNINSIKDVVEIDTESRRIAKEFITLHRI